MSSDYYNLEEAAKVLSLPTAEVNRLREQNKLRAFRDGSNWKFRRADVDRHLAEMIKARGQHDKSSSESGFDLQGEESSGSTFDNIMEDGLPLDTGELIDAVSAGQSEDAEFDVEMDDDLVAVDEDAPGSDVDLAAEDSIGFDLADNIASSQVPSISDIDLAEGGEETIGLALHDDSDLSGVKPSSSGIDLASDEESVPLAPATGTSSQLDLVGDSALSLIGEAKPKNLDEEENLFYVATDEKDDFDIFDSHEGSEGTESLVIRTEDEDEIEQSIVIPTENDFDLEPGAAASGEDSESSSQVVAIPTGDLGLGSGGVELGFGADDASPFNFGGDLSSAGAAPAPGDFGTTEGPFGSGGFTSDAFAPVSAGPTVSVTQVSEEYSTRVLISLAAAVCVLILPGLMLVDMMASMWSWNEPFALNSAIMSTIAGWFGLI
jgi:excisionase family DNA binding protein